MNEDRTKREFITKTVDKWRLDQNATEIISQISKAIQKAEKNGWKDLKISTLEEEGDENNLPETYLILKGLRLENDQEYFSRLSANIRTLRNNLDHAERMMANKPQMETLIQNYQKALEKTSLKCEACQKPSNIEILFGGDSKRKNLCGNCSPQYQELRKTYSETKALNLLKSMFPKN